MLYGGDADAGMRNDKSGGHDGGEGVETEVNGARSSTAIRPSTDW